MAGHVYKQDFYTYIGEGSRGSAAIVVPLVLANVKVASVLDVGAGNGSWISVWLKNGVGDALAVDGDYVDPAQLVIPHDRFRAHDLSQPLDLGRRFDLVQTLEVAEHIAEANADTFVDNLVRHGDVVLFSAAVRHQGGEFHVNEQYPEYWRRKFAARGYACFDWMRPALEGQTQVRPWYRFNSLVYANKAGRARLSDAVLACEVPDDKAVPMWADFGWTMRRALVSLMPKAMVRAVAEGKATLEARLSGRKA